jgi:hypothetical protein
MLRSSLAQYEAQQQQGVVLTDKTIQGGNVGVAREWDARPHAGRVTTDELFCCLADRCAGTRKVYGDYDTRRAQRPYQQEDYCLEAQCRFRHDKFSEPSKCHSCNSIIDGHNRCDNKCRFCIGSAAAVEPCPPQVPCQDRFRRNLISAHGKWIDGYDKVRERHQLLVYGSARDLVVYKTLALWKQELDKRERYQYDGDACHVCGPNSGITTSITPYGYCKTDE